MVYLCLILFDRPSIVRRGVDNRERSIGMLQGKAVISSQLIPVRYVRGAGEKETLLPGSLSSVMHRKNRKKVCLLSSYFWSAKK